MIETTSVGMKKFYSSNHKDTAETEATTIQVGFFVEEPHIVSPSFPAMSETFPSNNVARTT